VRWGRARSFRSTSETSGPRSSAIVQPMTIIST
jgi:hypothetical protein